ncbi:wings apart-like protein homolog [Hippocampus comes]|uniref:WAPL cohesin release factor n=1 Tax=Hippocampus comes TaxID=109280 RepID=A0A3Q2Y7Q5_HIPCM|nr:PREDICTED: wings apart-like protein homolog [Hippocampus comes]XP_019715862.1 PREDICTED: wings apart-like protein homolog [Hippocampus comes]XP_019715863.1 PREDICTED: wings apart-like protein homolog [Hippocampus comes]
MTSRFGKTYNRKGGEANSKFEEVFSNRKPTLTTKWGETTYKAQLGAKRPHVKSGELSKRPRLEDSDSGDDPFGFDSDEESMSVDEGGAAETVAENVVTTDKIPSKTAADTKTVENNKPRCASAPQSSQMPAPTTSLSNAAAPSAHNSSGTQRTPVAPLSVVAQSTDVPGGSGDLQTTSSLSNDAPPSEESPGQEPPPEPVDNIPPSPFTLRASNCKKYQPRSRSNKLFSEDDADAPPEVATAPEKPNSVASASASNSAANAKVPAKPTGRGGGRVRDYTVLHPSCVSVCNVTIQDSIERSADELVTPATPADLGDAGQMKKKSEAQPKHARFRTACVKTKKTKAESKLEFFGFEDEEAQKGDEASEGSGGGKSSYKIKYFGFDDLSESDSDDDSPHVKEKKARTSAAALAALSFGVDSPHTSDSQDSQASSNTDTFDFADDSSPGGAEGQKGRSGKQSEKSKDLGGGFKKIFSGPKKSPAKAVYNARHWNQPESEELPVPALARSQTAPAILSSGGSSSSSSKDSNSHKDDGLFKAPPPPPKVIKSETIPTRPYQDIVTALKCRKEHKELYTVVQHVKHFNDVVEFGENQEFTDDFEYLETGLKSSQPLNTRCLSIISLATRCAMPSFRMHLRARGKVAQVFKMLSDSSQHPNLALCTAALMYILSRDRLNMDLDRACLELMIKLLELDQDYSAHQDQLTAKEVAKVKEKIRKLCETVHNKHLDLENITTGHLAMETLLSLTSKRAGDWFKEELRLLGGLDHIVDKVKECVQNLSQEDDKENLVASLWGAERCLRVLESVTVQNPENQGYLIAYKDSQLIVSSARALCYCEDMIQRYSRALNNSSLSAESGAASLPHCSFSNVGKAVEDCMRAVIGVLLNLTHDNEWGSTKTGEQDKLIVTALNCVLRVPRFIPQEQRFDVRVLGLGLLINLVEYSSRNRHYLVDMVYSMDDFCLEDSLTQPADPTQADALAETREDGAEKPEASGALAALVKLFLERERAAILAEAKTDDLISEAPKPQDQSGEWKETMGEIQWVAAEPNDSQPQPENPKKEEEDEELDLNKALQHAGKHMEDSIVASYTALLLGCLCQGSQVNVTTVRRHLPKGDFSIMTEMLKKFLSFMNLTCAVGTTGQKSISRVIDYLEHC